MTKKLKIVGPYTPEHKGPFCTRNKRPVEIVLRQGRGGKIWGYMGDDTELTSWEEDGQFDRAWERGTSWDLMCAREVPVAREFWLNEFKRGDGYIGVSHAHDTELHAINERHERENWNWTRTIHVREVTPGESE